MLVSAYKITKNPFICNERRKFICVSLFVTTEIERESIIFHPVFSVILSDRASFHKLHTKHNCHYNFYR